MIDLEHDFLGISGFPKQCPISGEKQNVLCTQSNARGDMSIVQVQTGSEYKRLLTGRRLAK